MRVDVRHDHTARNGSKHNMTLGGRDYLIQQNWVNSGGGYCAKSLLKNQLSSKTPARNGRPFFYGR